MKKTLGILLAILLAISASLSACANNDSSGSTTSASDITTEPPVTEDIYKPEIPEKDYTGAVFSMVSRDDSFHSYPVHTRDLYAEEITGDLMNDATYNRNKSVEAKYGITFKVTTFNENTGENLPNAAVSKAVLAGSPEYDLLLTHMINGAPGAVKGEFFNWNALPFIDSTKPYWSQGAVQGFSVGNKLCLSLSDMCVSSNDNTHCMLFNKILATDYSIPNLYDVVKANQWTFDKFRELSKNVVSDLDGNGKMDDKDLYGYFIGGGSGQLNYLWAGGSQVTSKDENNVPYLNMLSERTIAIYDWLYEFRFSGDAYYHANWHLDFPPTFFSGNHALFMTTQVGVINDLRNMDADFGILPYPKFDASQENYGHYVDGHATLMAVPITVEDPERVGIIIEELSYLSYKDLVPVYYDTIITTKFTRDEESGEMLDIIYNSRVFDFAYCYDDWNLAFAFSTMLDAKNKNFASYYEKKQSAETKSIEKAIAAYEQLP